MLLADSHCHLNLLDLSAYQGDLNKAVLAAREQGVNYFLNVSVSIKDFPAVLATAKHYSFVSASVGLHPNEQAEEVTANELIAYAQDDKVVAIGETGLDYYRNSGDLTWQQQRFREHISAAKSVAKPLIIHSRQAKADTLKILKEEQAQQVGGVLHCFTEDWEMAQQALDLGFYISFSGIVTFRNASEIQEVAKRIPLDRLLVETDAPYLAPVPLRGKVNQPAYIVHTAEFIAHLRKIDSEMLAHTTTENYFRLFNKAQR